MIEKYQQAVDNYFEVFKTLLSGVNFLLTKSASDKVDIIWEIRAKHRIKIYYETLKELKQRWIDLQINFKSIPQNTRKQKFLEKLKQVENEVTNVINEIQQEIKFLEDCYNKYSEKQKQQMLITYLKLQPIKKHTLKEFVRFWISTIED